MTRPAVLDPEAQTRRATVKLEEIRRAMAGLTDADASAREAAKLRLLELERGDLETLKAVVRESRPLAPSQAAALQDIVEHVYLSGDTYEKSNQGFLGILMPGPQLMGRQEDPGVVVEGRMPGFCGFPALRDGDAILDVDDQHLPQPLDQQAFTNLVMNCRPGRQIRLKVLRAGHVMQVPVKLDARPTEQAFNRDGGAEGFAYRRVQEADAYWKQNFGPLLDQP